MVCSGIFCSGQLGNWLSKRKRFLCVYRKQILPVHNLEFSQTQTHSGRRFSSHDLA